MADLHVTEIEIFGFSKRWSVERKWNKISNTGLVKTCRSGLTYLYVTRF
jgi:hypothetical protein